MILVSAGYDAHAADPLASMQLSTQAYGAFTERLRGAADRLCEGRLLLLLEGGYQLDALGASVAESLVVLCAEETREPAPAPCPVADWERVVARLSEAHPKSPPRGTLRQDTGP
jgi:acetoin utilization deacetylase AcuC-like enzyme